MRRDSRTRCFESGMTEIAADMTIHRVEGETLFASRGYRIYRSEDGGGRWQEDGRAAVPSWRKAMRPSLLRRISRGGVHHLVRQPDGSRICVVPGMIMRAEKDSSSYECVFRFRKGSRPLNLCCMPDGRIYWGEYFLNLRRSEPVRVFCSEDGGKNWNVAHTFDRGSICHVHRVAYDPYDDSVLVCTGDRNREVSILRTDDGFGTLIPLVRGEQRFRTTALIPVRSCILYGTDNPSGENHVMRLDRESGGVREVQKLPGPVLYGCRAGAHAVFSTMVEKRDHEVSIWAGDENSFRPVATFASRKMTAFWREIAGYSAVILPEGAGSGSGLFCTPVGTSEHPDSVMRISLDLK